MKKYISKNTLIVLLVNAIIAFGFYGEHLNSGFTALVGDQHSIVPIAQKFDNPELFKSDLFLNSLDNVKYYTPFFVQPLRFFAKFTNHNYMQALNVFNLFSHFLFGLLWYFLFFKVTRNFWVALIMSILIRGIVWLPGSEIWGITDVWSMMPRTVYAALMPLPFLFLSFSNKLKLVLSAFFIGLVFNFHPITGLGGILIYLTLIIDFYYSNRRNNCISIKFLPIVLFAILLGMLPFVFTYFTKTSIVADYNLELFDKAFSMRIPSVFESPIEYLKQWMRVKYFFFLIPLLTYFIVSLKNNLEFKKARLLLIITSLIIFLPSISVYVENFVNNRFNLNLRIAFQFIRLQKLAIIPGYFAMAFLLLKLQNKKHYLPILTCLFIFILTITKSSKFDSIPFAGDDIFRTILPNTLSFVEDNANRYSTLDKMAEYIEQNTNVDDVFFGSPMLRPSARRSVVLDTKGASAIIEGNPKQFIQWYLELTEMRSMPENDRIHFLIKKGVDYIVTKGDFNEKVILVHQIDDYKLYKIND